VLRLLEQHEALADELVAESPEVDIAGARADLAQQPRCIETVIEAEQRRAIRAFAVDHAIDEHVAHAREHRTDSAAQRESGRLVADDQRREPRLQRIGVRRDRAQCERRWRLRQPARLAPGVHARIVLALRELATQLSTEAEQIGHGRCACTLHARKGMQAELARIIASGEAMLFTGAGFSADACDRDGVPLPDSQQMARDLWQLAFADEPEPDASTLADLYDVALVRAPEALADYLERRLRVGDARLPAHYAAWFGAPWRRIYTLNVDDLEVAVQRQYELPRRLHSISAIAPRRSRERGAIDVVHLNGLVGDPISDVTFSTLQYAARLCGRDHEYEQLAADLARSPFVFAGTTLDEVTLWKHLELQRQKQGGGLRKLPRSYLISPALPRARRVLLESCNIEWVQATVDSSAPDRC